MRLLANLALWSIRTRRFPAKTRSQKGEKEAQEVAKRRWQHQEKTPLKEQRVEFQATASIKPLRTAKTVEILLAMGHMGKAESEGSFQATAGLPLDTARTANRDNLVWEVAVVEALQ